MQKITNNIIVILFTSFLLLGLFNYSEAENQITPPKRIYHDDKKLNYNPYWQDDEIYLEANLDDDPEDEVIISFAASYKLVPEKPLETNQQQFMPQKKEIPLIQNYTFYQFYDKGPDGHFHLIKTLSGMDRMGRVEVFSLSKGYPKAIAIFSPGGQSYTDLSIYQWREGGFRLLFNIGSQGSIELNSDKDPVEIHIGKTDETHGEMTFLWDTDTAEFRRL